MAVECRESVISPWVAMRPRFSQERLPSRNRAVVDSSGVWLHTEYDEGFIETLKGSFPWFTRYWSPADTAWRVEGPNYIKSALGIFKTFFPNGEVIQDEQG